jgi:uncharacterized DUF497 family protein
MAILIYVFIFRWFARRVKPFSSPKVLNDDYLYIQCGRMRYEWNQTKAESNKRKHGVRFVDAVVALEDDLALTIEDLSSFGEERFLTLGRSDSSKVLMVVWCIRREDTIRIISARKATPHEVKTFWAEVQR